MVTGVRCVKCGMLQLPRPTCKGCGAVLMGGAPPIDPPPAPVSAPPRQPAPAVERPAERSPSPPRRIWSTELRSLLMILGGVFGGLIILGILAVAGLAYVGRSLDTESRADLDALVPSIIRSWNAQELVRHASPELLHAAPPEKIQQLFSIFSSKLGPVKAYGGSRGDSRIDFTRRGILITAAYVAQAVFEKAPANIQIRMVRRNGVWQVLEFRVDSDALLR